MGTVHNIADLLVYTDPQGSEEWLAARRGVITGSKFKDARDYLKLTAAEAKEGKTRGKPSQKLLNYAMDVARERAGGRAAPVFVSAPMKIGSAEESNAIREVEIERGYMTTTAGFICTPDRRFGVSVDSLVETDGVVEVKTMVSSATLFEAVVEGNYEAYEDQCIGAMWLLNRQWVDLVLWAPDLQEAGLKGLHIHRIHRIQAKIDALEADLWQFAALVDQFYKALTLKVA